jgi:hypothetical protein
MLFRSGEQEFISWHYKTILLLNIPQSSLTFNYECVDMQLLELVADGMPNFVANFESNIAKYGVTV